MALPLPCAGKPGVLSSIASRVPMVRATDSRDPCKRVARTLLSSGRIGRRTAPLLFLLALGVFAAAFIPIGGVSGQDRAASPTSASSTSGFDLRDLDLTCSPCQDFFQYATGGWKKRNPIGPAYASWGRFSEIQETNLASLRRILESTSAARAESLKTEPNAASETNDQKLGDFYAACMDEKRIEADGLKPLAGELAHIGAISSNALLQNEIARLHTLGVRVLFGFGSGQDDKDSTQTIAQASQGGLGLPDRDYYTKQDQRSKNLRERYRKHIGKMLRLAGDDAGTAEAAANTVIELETRLAEASKTRVERRDPQASYHKMNLAELRELTPAFSWENYFRDIGFADIREVNVRQPEFFRALNSRLQDVPLSDWKTYLRWHLLRASAPALSSKFVKENFSFYNRTLTGVKEPLPRWRRCVNATDRDLGEALGQKYVAGAFSPEAKARAEAMVADLIAALRADLETLPWMSEATRREALAKLSAVRLKIGYPDTWRDYSDYHVVRGPYLENVQRSSRFEFHRALAKIGQPVDRDEWGMTPPTVNAYYDAGMNEIVFPAGILQPPLFDPKGDDALNYGAIGAVIGHELTHGFDDEGRQYDAKGNLRDWWTPEDVKNFQARAECIEKQFSAFVVQGDVHENGKLVLGESIADLGGLTIAHAAFERAVERGAAAGIQLPDNVDGFSKEQRFFLAFARVWATSARPEYERMMAVTDVHPLPRFRADGPVSNMPEFTAAFGCAAGDAMARPGEARCKIW
jgi:putative endopeptidase